MTKRKILRTEAYQWLYPSKNRTEYHHQEHTANNRRLRTLSLGWSEVLSLKKGRKQWVQKPRLASHKNATSSYCRLTSDPWERWHLWSSGRVVALHALDLCLMDNFAINYDQCQMAKFCFLNSDRLSWSILLWTVNIKHCFLADAIHGNVVS